jgi:AraC-like DNA-binding protein
MEPTRAQRFHYEEAKDFAERHFTDPNVRAEDAAVYAGVSARTLRGSLGACGTTWRELVRDLRLERARGLLRTTKHEIWAVARMCGYDSAPAFAKAFRASTELAPHEFRRGTGGPARAGGPTGAFYRPAARARALRVGEEPPTRSSAPSASEETVVLVEISEATERISDRRRLGVRDPLGGSSIAELAEERHNPKYLRDRAAFWRARRADYDAWIEENNAKSTAGDDEQEEDGLWGR